MRLKFNIKYATAIHTIQASTTVTVKNKLEYSQECNTSLA